jgi:hypothetical protein
MSWPDSEPLEKLETSNNPAHGHGGTDDERWHCLMTAMGWDWIDDYRRRAGRRW